MYFAVNPIEASLPDTIAQQLVELRSTVIDKPLHLFALIDGAFDEQLVTGNYGLRGQYHSLYSNTSLREFKAAAPHLLAIPNTAAPLEWLQQLTSRCTGKPMLSIIASTIDADALEQHLRPYLIAITPDTLEWPVRWADTRVQSALMAMLEKDQREYLLNPLYRWWSVARDGTLLQWDGAANQASAPADFNKLPLSDAAFSSLVDATEADAILADIFDRQPELLRDANPAQCHARIERQLALADTHGIDAAPARQHFSMLALILTDDAMQHPSMENLLHCTRHGANYQEQVRALPEDFWQELTRPTGNQCRL